MPDNLVTVFAGMEKDAVEETRKYFTGFAPSSPQMALIKDGKIIHMIQRHEIESNDANAVANKIAGALKRILQQSRCLKNLKSIYYIKKNRETVFPVFFI